MLTGAHTKHMTWHIKRIYKRKLEQTVIRYTTNVRIKLVTRYVNK